MIPDTIPPWIQYPEFVPGHSFWRQAGKYYIAYIWNPFWFKLSETEKKTYLQKWPMPASWVDFYQLHARLETVDLPDETKRQHQRQPNHGIGLPMRAFSQTRRLSKYVVIMFVVFASLYCWFS